MVLKKIIEAINKRLSGISSTKKDFDLAKDDYQKALNERGHKYNLNHKEPRDIRDTSNKDKNKRSIIWYKPPFNQAATTSLGKLFLTLVTKHFPKKHPLYSLLNRNNLNISYCCTKNIRAIIQSHNKNILDKTPKSIKRKCNCQKTRKDKYPLDNKCQQTDVTYYVTTTEPQPNKYDGSSCNLKKKRLLAHNHSFRHK